MKNIALAAAFVLEIIAFIGFAGLGFLLPGGHVLQAALAVILLALLITFWGLFMAPKAPKKFNLVPYYLAKAFIYALATLTIFQFRSPVQAGLFVLAAIIDEAFLFRHNLS